MDVFHLDSTVHEFIPRPDVVGIELDIASDVWTEFFQEEVQEISEEDVRLAFPDLVVEVLCEIAD